MSWPKNVAVTIRKLRQDGWRTSILFALPAAICAYLAALWLEGPSGQASVFDQVTYVGIAIAFSIVEVLLLRRKIPLNTAVMGILITASVQFAGKLIYLLYFNPRPENILAEFTETFFWLPSIYVLASFFPGLKRGRLVSSIFFSIFFVASLFYVVPNWIAGTNFGVSYALIELTLANVTLLALTTNFLGFSESFARARARAETMERLAFSDRLTDLPNRLALERDLERLIAERARETKIAVAFIDIDGFKLVNDSRGHAVGDKLLGDFAARLDDAKREGEHVYRISGDEFVILFGNLPDTLTLADMGKGIQKVLEPPFYLDKQALSVSASVGVAYCPDDGESAATLLKHADAAMYTVKHSGKNGIASYEASRDQHFEDRVALVGELQSAIQHETFELYYQPIIDAETNRPVKLEALLRWHSVTAGNVPPLEFVALAEEYGLIQRLGDLVLKMACRQIQAWELQGIKDLTVSVNVSAQQLQDPYFAAKVREALRSAMVAPYKLELELTESSVIDESSHVTENLRELRRLGVSVALDDFGTGYSSLSYLEVLDFDTIKIDRSFADKLTHNRKNPQYPTAIIRAVMEIANSLDAEVVAEGIETKEQVEMFRSLGCRFLQGYYFGKPMPREDITELLERPPGVGESEARHRRYN